jgi:predicted regulator of Ras-like GTPase activity (Roadblock/LC7/MglB family)
MSDEPRTVRSLLTELIEHDAVLGAIAVTAEGLVMAAAGIEDDEAEMIGALGASLVGVAERTIRRLGSSTGAQTVSVGTSEGTVQIWAKDEIALIVLTEPTGRTAVGQRAEATLTQILGSLVPV